MHPDASKAACDGQIVKAHTIQRNGGLSRIARDGHVYQFLQDLSTLIKTNGVYEPHLVGIKEASTFTGFCAKHDCSTFAPIENEPLVMTPQQCCLLAYRATCMELYKKSGILRQAELIRDMDRGRDVLSQVAIQNYLRDHLIGVDMALKQLGLLKQSFEKAISSGNYSEVAYYAIVLDQCPEVLCSGMVSPDIDFVNNALQDLGDTSTPADGLAFSLMPTDSGGAAVFTWIAGGNGSVDALVRSLHSLPDEDKPHAIVRFCFEVFENVFINPEWWENLTLSARSTITRRANTFVDYDLVDDGLRVVPWTVSGVTSSLPL